MRPGHEIHLAHWLIDAGLNDCQISRTLLVPRRTILDWRHHGPRWRQERGVSDDAPTRSARADADCPRCSAATISERAYSYLLAMYLGDGCLSEHPRQVYALRISCCDQYPRIKLQCERAIRAMRPSKDVRVFRTQSIGCTEIASLWKHWPCLFPQHGPGRKHTRPIELADWQAAVVARHPDAFLRGLIHSDGYRGPNFVNGKGYMRYQFTNVSDDIRDLFCRACDLLGVRWRRMNARTISVARRLDVARLDEFVGPKK
jgi:hypothetical protein